MDAAPLVIGIDIAASRPCVAVAVRCGRTLEVVEWREADEREPGDRGRMLDWVSKHRPAVVGVDAPQRPKRALPGGRAHSRNCDSELLHRRISVYQVPTRAEAEAEARRYAWMHSGWRTSRSWAGAATSRRPPDPCPASSGRRRPFSRCIRTPGS
jgi:Protein of unknown function (DUF429)